MGNLDINIGKLKKNAFRYSKVRGETASRIRIPGGVIDAASLGKVVEIAEKYGNGVIDITNRQGIEIPGIKLTDMDAVNKEIQGIIDTLPPAQETFRHVPAHVSVRSDAMTRRHLLRKWKSWYIRMTAT